MFYYNPAERPIKTLLPGINARTFWGENMLAALVDLEANTELPRHSHPQEQMGIVISGQIEFNIGGETQTLHPGQIYIIPGGVEHAARTFAEPVQVLDVFSPVRADYQY